MNRFLAILLLFAGFAMILLGGLLVLTGLVTYPKSPVQAPGPCWPVVGIGFGMACAGWLIKRRGLSRWRAAAAVTQMEEEK